MEFLSDNWFSASSEALQRCSAPGEVADVAVQFQAPDTGHSWVEVIEDGRVAQWRAGEIDEPDLIVHMDASVAWGAATGTLRGSAVLSAISTAEPARTGSSPPSPMDLTHGDITEMMKIPGATLAVQYEYTRGPWGDVSFALRLVDGQIDSTTLERLEEPDITAQCTYRQMALVRRGEIAILDVLMEGGTVSGSEGALALLGGISESPEFQAIERGCGASGLVLGTLGEVHASPGFAAALDDVMALTEPAEPVA